MSSSINTLSIAAEDRKARLAKLRGIKRKLTNDESAAPDAERPAPQPAQSDDDVDIARQHLSGRNYDFETKGPKLGFEHMPNVGLEKPTLEEQAAEVEAEVQKQAAEEEKGGKAIDLFKLQPKKPNWDLKRKLEPKMAILDVRTDNAIAKIVRERIKEAQNAAKKTSQSVENNANNEDGESAGFDGITLVESLRVREQEDQDEENREREEDEALDA